MEVDFYSTLESVREKIERGEKYYALLNDKSKWNQYCASLYAIEDAQCAIEAYTSYEFPTDIKGKYLYIYGLLQSLFLQQDAANGISTALLGKKIDFKQEYPKHFFLSLPVMVPILELVISFDIFFLFFQMLY